MQRLMMKFGLLAAVLVISGCATSAPPREPTANIRLRILVDGADTIYLQGDRLWLKHHAYEHPGQWRGIDVPLVINGQEWSPNWVGNASSVFQGVEPQLPSEAVRVTLDSYSVASGWVKILQQPTPENQFTLSLSVDDRVPQGAHWYTIDIDW